MLHACLTLKSMGVAKWSKTLVREHSTTHNIQEYTLGSHNSHRTWQYLGVYQLRETSQFDPEGNWTPNRLVGLGRLRYETDA